MNNNLKINGENLLQMENEKTIENILKGFWRWVELMDVGNFDKAVEAIYWDKGKAMMPNDFQKRITTFFEIDGNPMEVVYPCQELIEMVNDAIEVEWENIYQSTRNHVGWCMLKIPVTNDKEEAKKSTKAGLWAVASSFFIREINEKYVFEFEIFQL